MKPAIKIEPFPDTTNTLMNKLQDALNSTNLSIKSWLEAQINIILAELPFREAALRKDLAPLKEIPSNRSLTPQEASKLLNIPVRWIYRHTKKLPQRRFGKYIRFPERELLKWAEGKRNLGI